jgi:hypothetical protein
VQRLELTSGACSYLPRQQEDVVFSCGNQTVYDFMGDLYRQAKLCQC